MIDQDKALQDALTTMTRTDSAGDAPKPKRGTRRSVIIPEVEAPEQGYRIVLGDSDMALDIQASCRGEAVLMALDFARGSDNPNLRNAGAHVFLWTFTVTDAQGATVRGADMREEVQAARIARSAARARRLNG